MKRILPLFLILLFFLPSLACGSFTTNFVKGSGNIVTQTFDVSGFDRIALEGFGEVFVEQGQTESLSVQTDDNLISLLDIKVQGKELRLGIKPGVDASPTESITYNVTVRDLNGVSLSGSGNFHVAAVKSSDLTVSLAGSGDIDVKSAEADNLSLDLNGSGNITIEAINANTVDTSLEGSGTIKLEGNARTQTLALSGSGNYLAEDLEIDKTDITVPGSGNVTVWTNDELKLRISGSGSIQYYGNPTVDQSVSGSGSITSLGEK